MKKLLEVIVESFHNLFNPTQKIALFEVTDYDHEHELDRKNFEEVI